MLRRNCLKLIGASSSVGAFGTGTAVAEGATSVGQKDGVRFLNFGLPRGRPSSGITVTVDGKRATEELRFGEFSRTVELTSGERTVEMTDVQADVTTSTTVTVDSSQSVISLVGGTDETRPDVVALSEADLFGDQGIQVANLTDADRLTASAGRGESQIRRGSVGSIGRAVDANLRISAEGGEYSTNARFDCLSLDTAPTVLIGGSVSNAAAPVGTVAMHNGGD